MKKTYITVVCVAIASLLISGCQSADVATTEPVVIEPEVMVFSATGQSVATTDDAMSMAKAELAATTVAKANLLAKIKGELISGSAEVSDLMFVSQAAKTTVNGWMSNAQIKIVKAQKELTNLPEEEPVTQIVTAVASLEVSQEDMDDMKKFVE